MSTVTIGAGGPPHPNARVVAVIDVDAPNASTYEIRDGKKVCARCATKAQAQILLPLIQRGE